MCGRRKEHVLSKILRKKRISILVTWISRDLCETQQDIPFKASGLRREQVLSKTFRKKRISILVTVISRDPCNRYRIARKTLRDINGPYKRENIDLASLINARIILTGVRESNNTRRVATATRFFSRQTASEKNEWLITRAYRASGCLRKTVKTQRETEFA